MAVTGFNVGTTFSMKDINLAVDYLSDKGAFEPDLQNIKDKITRKEKYEGAGGQSELTDAAPVECGQDVAF